MTDWPPTHAYAPGDRVNLHIPPTWWDRVRMFFGSKRKSPASENAGHWPHARSWRWFRGTMMTKKFTDEEMARSGGWEILECDGFQCVMQAEHGWLAPDWKAAATPGYKPGPWLATLRVSHPEFFTR